MRAARGGTRRGTRAEALDALDARTVGARRSMMRASRGLGTRARERGGALDDVRATRAVRARDGVYRWCAMVLNRERRALERRWDDGWNRVALAENRFGSSV
jgi:hypothetical protein